MPAQFLHFNSCSACSSASTTSFSPIFEHLPFHRVECRGVSERQPFSENIVDLVMGWGRLSGLDNDVGLIPIAVKVLVDEFLFDGVGLALGVHSVSLDYDEQVDIARSIGSASRDAPEEDNADIVPNPFFEFSENCSDWRVIRRLRDGGYRIIRLDEHLWVHPNGIRPARSVDGDYTECVKCINGSIYSTQPFSGNPMKLSIRERSIWIVDEDMQDVRGCPIPERILVAERNGESDV